MLQSASLLLLLFRREYEARHEPKKTRKSTGALKRAVKRSGPSRRKVEKVLNR